MGIRAYFNEIDPFCCAWLSNLMDAGLITPGKIDDRSILALRPEDLRGYDRAHFFAGIGIWDYALTQAGWPDDGRVTWTGSCPCQPLSGAGQRKGHADERHLWPAFHALITECRPATVFGEQVGGKDGREWLAAVRADMEGDGYAVGAADLPACGTGAPHIRQRLWFVAHRLEHAAGNGRDEWRPEPSQRGAVGGRGPGGVADAGGAGLPPREREAVCGAGRKDEGRAVEQRSGASAGGLADAACEQHNGSRNAGPGRRAEHPDGGPTGGLADADSAGRRFERSAGLQRPEFHDPDRCGKDHRPGPDHGFWRNSDWLLCRDGKWRPTQSGVFEIPPGLADSLGYRRIEDRWSLDPLVQKTENRVGRLRGYGNAINAETAKVFIEACMDVL